MTEAVVTPVQRKSTPRYGRTLTACGFFFSLALIIFGLVLGWQARLLSASIDQTSASMTPQLIATYQLSSDLTSLRTLTSQMAEDRTIAEAQTSFQRLQSRNEAIISHLNTLRNTGIPDGPLAHAVRIHGELSDDGRTIFALVQQKLGLEQRLHALQQLPSPQPQDASELSALQRSIQSVERQISNLGIRGSHIASQLTPMISTLTTHIQQVQKERIALNQNKLDTFLTIITVGISIIILLSLAFLWSIHRQVIVRINALWEAMVSWRTGFSPERLPRGNDRIADMGRLLLDITEQSQTSQHSPLTSSLSPQQFLGVLPREAFISALNRACGQPQSATRGKLWLFMGRLDDLDGLIATYGHSVTSTIFQHVARHWAFLGGPDSVAGAMNDRDLALFLYLPSEQHALAQANILEHAIASNPIQLLNRTTISVKFFVGHDCYQYSDHQDAIETLMARADNAMVQRRRSALTPFRPAS